MTNANTDAAGGAKKTTPQNAEDMVAALKASIAAVEAKKAIELANRVALAHRIGGASPFAAKLAALDALIAQVSR